MKVTEAIDLFFSQNNYSEKTVISYRTDIIKFINLVFQEYEKDAVVEQFEYVDADIIKAHYHSFNKNSTYNRFLTVIRNFITFLKESGLIQADISYLGEIQSIPVDTESTEVIEGDDIIIFLSEIGKEKSRGYEKQLMLLTALETGIRMEDLLHLKWSSFMEDENGNTFMVDYSKYRDHTIKPVSKAFLRTLQTIQSENEKVFYMLSPKAITGSITRTKVRLQKANRKISYTSFTKAHEQFIKDGYEMNMDYIFKNVLERGLIMSGGV